MGLKGVTHYYCKSNQRDKIIFDLLEKLAAIETKPQVIIFFNEIVELRGFYSMLKKERDRFVINDASAS